MNASPFDPFFNAILQITVPGEGVFLNPETLNYEVEAESNLSVKAFLKPSKPNIQYREGLDITENYLTGYLVEPMMLPVTIEFPLKVPCTLNTGNGEATGEFELLFVVGSPVNVEEIIGQKIAGIFRLTGVGN